MQRLSAEQLNTYLETRTPTPQLIDVREPWEFEICHIPASQNIPLGQIPQALVQLDPQKETVLICHHGIRSLRAALFLQHHGFKSVINLEGGVDAWADQVDPDMSKY